MKEEKCIRKCGRLADWDNYGSECRECNQKGNEFVNSFVR